MIEFTNISGSLAELRAVGVLTDADYKQILIPRLERLFAQHGKLDLLLFFDETFEGWDLSAAWDDALFGIRHRADFGKIALVGAPQWVEMCVTLGGFLMKGEMRTFARDQLELARQWMQG